MATIETAPSLRQPMQYKSKVDRIWAIEGPYSDSFKDHILSTPG